jgi:AmpD protein
MAGGCEAAMFEVENGILRGARYLASPNYDERPAGAAIDLLVIHGISLPPGQFGGHFIDALFTNTLDRLAHPYFEQIHAMRVSAHALIRRDGGVVQYVPFDKRAWHAGKSCFQGRETCNDFSIGIELEGCDECGYEDVQYRVLAALSAALMRAYPRITPERIAGHSDIAPGRKTDPGPYFEWPRYRGLLEAGLGPVSRQA